MPFIVLEGPDGGGTTTHSTRLAQQLRDDGVDVLLTAEPSDGLIGNQIRSVLKDHKTIPADALQLMFCADRAEHIARVIEPALRAGKTVVCDRYVLSTLVYGEALGLSAPWLQQINEHFPKPDRTLLLLPPFAVCRERMGRRSSRDALESDDLLQRVHGGYEKRSDQCDAIIDTSADLDTVAKQISAAIR